MSRVSELRPEAKLALLLLEELALRGGTVKLRFLKTYRYLVFWLGRNRAEYFLRRLVEGGYIEWKGKYVRLKVRKTPSLTYGKLLKLIDETIRELYLERDKKDSSS